jgi:hypothetical protein
MTFEEKLLNKSTIKIAKLYGPACKAAIKPDTGITIQNKSAYFVIRDTATITKDYLPLAVWACFQNPFAELKGIFTKGDIENFVQRSTNIPVKSLLKLILADYNQASPPPANITPITSPPVESDDIYGDYGIETPAPQQPTQYVDLTNSKAIIETLMKAFNIKE